MERDHHHQQHHQTVPKQEIINNSSSLLSPKTADSPRNNKTAAGNSNNNANDRLKRDEWSEGAVSCLLEAYESKWVLRNRAKLKGQDWEDVAKHVSARANCTKSAKTQTQCKNKIESMKKRYRSESAAAEASSWPLYPRLDLLLRGNGNPVAVSAAAPPPPVAGEPAPALPPLPMVAPQVLQPGSFAQNSHASDGVDRLAKVDANNNNNNTRAKSMDDESQKNPNSIDDTNSSTPAIYAEKGATPSHPKSNAERKNKAARKRKTDQYWEIGESIRWMAEVVVRSEQARMETMREIERMRAEAETKRGEMDLKRTEIIANTQLEIAKLFAKGSASVDSALKIGRS